MQHDLRAQPDYKKTVPIQGMHCASCEILITDELEALPGVTKADVSLARKSATITSSRALPNNEIAEAVRAAGYEVGVDTGKRPFITSDKRIWRDVALGMIAVLGLWVLLQVLGLDKIGTTSASSSGTGVMALVIGITAGFSTCMALIGGLVLGVAAKYAENHPTQTTFQKFRPHLFFNAGRILGFTVFGALIGLLGSALAMSGALLGFLTIGVGVVMLMLGLQLTELFPRLTKGLTLPSGIAAKLGISGRKNREYSHKNAFLMGGMTFFLPCGFTQAMQLLAVSTGDPVKAALIMGLFAVGTAPGLLSLGGLASLVKGAFAKRFFRVVGVAVVAMALVNVTNGATLAGVDRFVAGLAQSSASRPAAETSEGSELLQTTYTYSQDIVPSTFTAKVGQKTTLVVDVKDEGRGCMSTIMILGLDDTPQFLQKGKKLELTFTATKPGTYTIACAMGIPRGSITVTEA